MRELSRPTPQELPETAAASYPFWSPDSRRSHFSRGRLYTIDASGANVRTVCDARYPRGGAWSPGDVILFAGQWGRPPCAGRRRAAVAITELGTEASHRFPQFLPDGRHFLFIGFGFSRAPGETSVYLGSLGSTEYRPLLKASAAALHAPPGWILFGATRASSPSASTRTSSPSKASPSRSSSRCARW